MRPVKIRDDNVDFLPPAGWKDDEDGKCGVLSVRREVVGKKTYHHSNWRPSPGELDLLVVGGVVELVCVGVQPPVAVGVVPGIVEDQAKKTG